VVEGQRSEPIDDGPPFTLVTVPEPLSASNATLHRTFRRIVYLLGVTGEIGFQLLHHGVDTARRLPRGDLYYLHAPQQFPAIALGCHRAPTPFIYDAHDYYSGGEEDPRSVGERIRARWLLAVERACVLRAAEVVTTSEGNAAALEATFGRRPEVIYNTHDARLDRSAAPTVREECGLSMGTFLVVVAGNAKAGAAIDNVLCALMSVAGDIHVAFVGNGYEQHRAVAGKLGVGDRAHFLDPVPPTEYAQFVATADVALIPYFAHNRAYRNAIGNRFFVAIAAGLPVLYPIDLPDLARLAEKHRVGLEIDSRRHETIAAAIAKLRADPELLATLRANVTEAAGELSWEGEESNLRHLVDRVLE